MKINNNIPFIRKDSANSSSKNVSSKSSNAYNTTDSKSVPQATAKDTLQLSSNSKLLKDMVQQLKDMPDPRKALIDELRNSVANGTYNVSSARISESIVSKVYLKNS